MVLQWAVIVALALSLSACGKRSAPELPEGKTDQFPRQYPDPSSL
jgi:predicted small lipoprotein YifL